MKTIIINASPRKNWNTAQLLKQAQKGAESVGARALEQLGRQQQLEFARFHLDAGTAVLPDMALSEGRRAREREHGSSEGNGTDQLFVHRIVPFHGKLIYF